MRRHAFTLIELLVVVAIIGVVIGIALPAMSAARASARRTACASNLRQIGIGLRAYIGAHRDRLPHASFMPSMGPFPLDVAAPIAISNVLLADVGNDPKVFHCPNDDSGRVRPAPNAGRSYFESEGSSYEFRFQLGGLAIDEAAKRFSQFTTRTVAENTIWIMRDYDNFHGEGGKPGARRYLYIDGHVTDYEN